MKKPRILLSCMIVCGWMTGNLLSQQPALIKIDLDRAIGKVDPIIYGALGNEIDGPWQMGQKNAEDNCKFALEAANVMQQVERNIKFIACGASNYRPDADNACIDWNDYVLQHMAGKID